MRLATLILFCGMVWLITSCGSSPSKIDEPPQELKAAKTVTITTEGNNEDSHFSNDGKKLIYLSRGRPGLPKNQVFIYDLASKKERRLTFNDGEDFSPRFSPDGKFVLYASTTDEIKETVDARPEPKNGEVPESDLAKGYELYLARADGSHRERLTKNPGFDAEATFFADGRHLIFSGFREGDVNLYLIDTSTLRAKPLTMGKRIDRHPSISIDGKRLVWTRVNDKDENHSTLYKANYSHGVLKEISNVSKRVALFAHPRWASDNRRIVFSSDLAVPGKMDVYTYDVSNSCLKRLTFDDGDKLYPSLSQDGRFLTYTLRKDKDEPSQIVVIDFVESKECLEEKP